jgi:hypothetical protein
MYYLSGTFREFLNLLNILMHLVQVDNILMRAPIGESALPGVILRLCINVQIYWLGCNRVILMVTLEESYVKWLWNSWR